MTTEVMPPANRLGEIDPASDLGFLLFDESPVAIQAWIERFLTVPNEHGQTVAMKLYPQQKMMLVDETGRDVTVKGRQTRATTLKMARNLRSLVTGKLWGANAVVGAQDDQTTQGVSFRKRIQHHMRDLAAAGFDFETIDNADEFVIKDLDNRFIWVSGEQRVMSRGQAVQILHFSELAHWKPSALELIGGALPAVPSSGRIDFESTPKGEEGAFYVYAMQRSRPHDPHGLWTAHLYPWWLEPRYCVSDDPTTGYDIHLTRAELADYEANFAPTEHESTLMDRHGLNMRQIIWRQLKKVELDATHAPFLQEYPEDLDTCWLGMEGKFFDTADGIDHLEFYRDARIEAPRRLERLTYRGDQVSFYGPNLCIWESPTQEDTYVGGFDAAGGGVGKDADSSVLYIFSVKKEKIVARLRVQASPKVFAAMICAVGTYYKSATISGERSHQGDMVFVEMRDQGYSAIYYHVDPLKSKERPQAGLYPSQPHRQMVLEKFKVGIVSNALISFDPELVREMNIFTWQKFQGRMKVAALDLVGLHDDCIFAASHGWFIIDKVRNRLRTRPENELPVVTGPLNRVVSNRDLPRSHQLWFT